jgi:hypothetical protein
MSPSSSRPTSAATGAPGRARSDHGRTAVAVRWFRRKSRRCGPCGWSDSEGSELGYVGIGRDRSLAHAGELGLKRRAPAPGYRCEVSCVDWYGNSRPIFTGGRIFALMGTELVEGRLDGGRMSEIGRLDLTGAPRLARAPIHPPARAPAP